MLVRGVGPSLTAFGVAEVLADPQLSLVAAGGSAVAADDNWDADPVQAAAISAIGAQVGAFPLTTSLDAATSVTLPPGGYTYQISGHDGGTGVALAETYDASPAAAGAIRLVNVSARGRTAPGAQTLTAGFVIDGGNVKRVLIRASGPGLVPYGVAGVLSDPAVAVYAGQRRVAAKQGAADLTVASASNATGAFPQVGTDTGLCLTLGPGSYSAQATSASGASGTVLLEVYEVP